MSCMYVYNVCKGHVPQAIIVQFMILHQNNVVHVGPTVEVKAIETSPFVHKVHINPRLVLQTVFAVQLVISVQTRE